MESRRGCGADDSWAPEATAPILVMDMYEHSYQIDVGGAAAKSIEAFFANIQWQVVAQRLSAAGA